MFVAVDLDQTGVARPMRVTALPQGTRANGARAPGPWWRARKQPAGMLFRCAGRWPM